MMMSADFGGAVGQLPGSNLLTVFLDTDRDPSDEIRFDFGLPGDVAVAGDWNRDGFDNVGMVRAHPDGFAQWLLDTNRDPHAEHIFRFGLNGDHMLVADFNGDSIDDIAAVRAAPVVDPVVGLPRLTWYISYGPFDDLPHDSFASVSNVMEYGFQGDKPVAGDWDGDGAANPGIVSQVPVFYGGTAINRWYLQGSTHVDFGFPTDIPIVGDWNGNGADNVGAIREQPGAPSFWFGDTNGDPTDEVRFQFGLQGYQYIAGSWQPDDIAPTASLSAPDPSQGSSRTNIVVHYNDNNYIDSPQFSHGDLRVTGPGYTQAARLESVSGNGRSYTVTYSISAPGGQWDAADNGTYTIEVLPNRVCDLSDNCVQPGPLAEFTVALGSSTLYLVFDGMQISRGDLERWSQDWHDPQATLASVDPEGDGISVAPFMAGDPRRDSIISQISAYVADDISPFGIEIVREPSVVVEGIGSTTVFVGPATIPHPHIALDIDEGNDNETDIAFVGDESAAWVTPSRIALAQADVIIHEAGHTWGLYHVVSGSAPETMGWRYNNPPSVWDRDTAFLNQSFQIFPGHGPARMQNSYQVLAGHFGLNPTLPSVPFTKAIVDEPSTVSPEISRIAIAPVFESLAVVANQGRHVLKAHRGGTPLTDAVESSQFSHRSTMPSPSFARNAHPGKVAVSPSGRSVGERSSIATRAVDNLFASLADQGHGVDDEHYLTGVVNAC